MPRASWPARAKRKAQTMPSAWACAAALSRGRSRRVLAAGSTRHTAGRGNPCLSWPAGGKVEATAAINRPVQTAAHWPLVRPPARRQSSRPSSHPRSWQQRRHHYRPELTLLRSSEGHTRYQRRRDRPPGIDSPESSSLAATSDSELSQKPSAYAPRADSNRSRRTNWARSTEWRSRVLTIVRATGEQLL